MASNFIYAALRPASLAQSAECSTRKVLSPTSISCSDCHHPITVGGSTLTHALGNFSEAITGRCHLENINGVVLQKVVEYLYYNDRNRDSIGIPDMEIPPELCLELLMAADYLDT